MHKHLTTIQSALSGQRIYTTIGEISNFHRIQASTGYRAAAHHLFNRLQAYGFNPTLHSYPANNNTWALTWKMFQEWDCRGASLNLIDSGRCLADFQSHNQSIIQRSYPCDYRNQPLDIVLLDQGSDASKYNGLDLTGKLVFVREHFQAYFWAIKQGALGFVTDYLRPLEGVRTRYDLYDTYNYTSFWWQDSANDLPTFGFVLTPRDGDYLAQLCREQLQKHEQDASQDRYVKATCFVDSSLYDGAIEVLDTLIAGETDEEVLITSHLCHPRPSANDNSSGVATSLEVMHVLNTLIKQGKLPKPKRGIRLIYMPEFTGTFAYFADPKVDASRMKAGINMDMVGARQSNVYGPITITNVSHANPAICNDVAALVLDHVKCGASGIGYEQSVPMFNSTITPFAGGSDHIITSDPTLNIPSPMLGQWPDKTYHTSSDTLDVIDPYILHQSAAICAGYIYTLANLNADDVPLILHKNRERFMLDLNQVLAPRSQPHDPQFLLDQVDHYVNLYKACVQSLEDWLPVEQQHLDQAKQTLDQLKQTLWDDYRIAFAPDFTPQDQEIPEAYRYVPQRRYIGPIMGLDHHIKNEPSREQAYNDFKKQFSKLNQGLGAMELIIQYLIDGQRSVAEIAQAVAGETGLNNVEYVHAYVQLLHAFDLVTIG